MMSATNGIGLLCIVTLCATCIGQGWRNRQIMTEGLKVVMKTKRKDKYKEIVKKHKTAEKLIENGDVWDFIDDLQDYACWHDQEIIYWSSYAKRKKHWHSELITEILQSSLIEIIASKGDKEITLDNQIVSMRLHYKKRKRKKYKLICEYRCLSAMAKDAERHADELFGDEEYEWKIYFVYGDFRKRKRIEIDNRETVFIW